ncbi:MAG: hypothetical protein IPL65_17015 [Lewinellaceae bacterium]|nr:hypothetical protein [Lewinellaceae bacterium]
MLEFWEPLLTDSQCAAQLNHPVQRWDAITPAGARCTVEAEAPLEQKPASSAETARYRLDVTQIELAQAADWSMW